MSALTSTVQPRAEHAILAVAEASTEAPLLVRDVGAVARSRLLTVSPSSFLVEVAAQLSSAQISVVVVTDPAGAPLGTITETVLVKRLGLGPADFFKTRAADVMTQGGFACAPDDLLSDVLATMHARGSIHVLIVDSGGTVAGVLNARDGLRALLAAGNHEGALLRNYVFGVGYQ